MVNKKLLSTLLCGGIIFSLTGTFTSCSEDYDDEINNLQEQIDAQKASLEKIEALLQSGVVITEVKSDAAGIRLSLSNGDEYILNHGNDGKDAAVWTIESDGYWYCNGTKTEYKAIGIDGKDGADGKDGNDGKDGADGKDGNDGKDGADGKDGKDGNDGKDGKDGVDGENGEYYVPNSETGCFDVYKDGKFVRKTEISWRAAGITAVVDGNVLKLTGVEGTEGEVILYLGKALGSVAFIPEAYSNELPLPTTSENFLHIRNYYVEGKFVSGSSLLRAEVLNKSNTQNLRYRLNPTDAYINGAAISFINRDVTTRAIAGDDTDLLDTVKVTRTTDGELIINTLVNPQALNSKSIAALQIWAGTTPVTSDYIHVKSTGIDAEIVKDAISKTRYYDRKQNGNIVGLKNNENDAFIKQFVALDAPANLSFMYLGSLDLTKYVELYSFEKSKTIEALGFSGVSFKYSLPEKYEANDNQKTNQNWFVKLDENGVLSVAEGKGTSAIGRTPVVRVDAYVTDNKGTDRLVASSYIKVEITEKPVDPDKDKEDINITLETPKTFIYQNLTSVYTTVNLMPYTQINTELYAKAGLTAETFWNQYGGDDEEFDITVKTSTGQIVLTGTGKGKNGMVEGKGIRVNVDLNSSNTTTSRVEILVNNEVETKHNEAAKYIVTISIKADNNKVYSNFVITQEFSVTENCEKFEFNENYYRSSYADLSGDLILVKGQLNSSNLWEMSSYLGEHFKKIGGKDIFGYYSDHKNVVDIEFSTKESGVRINNNIISLEKALDREFKVAEVDYAVTLVNGEKCEFSYRVIFENPFVSGSKQGIVLKDLIGTSTAEAAAQVVVNDNAGRTILSYISGAFSLSQVATETYKVGMPNVKFAFKKDTAYNNFVGQLVNGTEFNINETTGTVTWKNNGTSLAKTQNFTVIATVTFEDLSVVECEIPVTIEAVK